MVRHSLLTVMLMAFVAACGNGIEGIEPTSTTEAVAVAGPNDLMVPRCRDVKTLEGTGIGVNPGAPPIGLTQNGDERLREALFQYFDGYQSTFAGFWIDRVNGSFALAFTDDIDGHVQRVARIAGDRQLVTIVPAQVTEAELRERQQEVGVLLRQGSAVYGSGASSTLGLVSLDLSVYDEDTVAAVVEAVGPQMICVDGPDPEETIPEGPQPDNGDGWRLLVDAFGRGAPYRTGFVETPEQFADLWAKLEIPSDIPVIDFETEAVIYFGPAVSGSCRNIRLDDVIFDDDQIRPVIVLPGGAQACTADANPHAYVVAVDRSRLPEPPFTIDLFEELCRVASGVCEEQRTTVEP